MSKTITFVTSNANKLREVSQVMSTNKTLNFINVDIDLPEFQGTAEDVAKFKCIEATKHISGPVIVEDTSLSFNALNGMPGPYIKWFLKAVGPDGLYKMVSGFEDHTAFAQCTFAYKENKDAEVKLFVGKCDGKIVEPRGATTFGWDPCFEPKAQPNVSSEGDKVQTFAEMDGLVKNGISHRGKALEELKQYFE